MDEKTELIKLLLSYNEDSSQQATRYPKEKGSEPARSKLRGIAPKEIEEEAIGVFKAQTSKNTSYVDCTNMVFMKRLDLDAIFSFDEVYRKNGLTLVEVLLTTKLQAA